jgi:hypothetical protein
MTDYVSPSFSREPAALPGSTATARVIEELQLYGYRPNEDEPDPRPLPEADRLEQAIAGLFQMISETFSDTRLEPDLPDILWHITDVFHRKSDRVQRQADDNEMKQRSSQKDQDGSEVRSVELERLINQGLTILERRNVFELCRDTAAEHYESETGSAWRPRAGSMVNRNLQTAAMIDSRDFLAAKKIKETEVMIPPGTRIAFSGGTECQDTARIWAVLDKALARYPDMVLMHGNAKGADKIASLWASNRKITQIAFEPDWKKDGKACVFKRNDRMLEAQPLHLIAFPGTGITDNIVDKAKKLRIKIADFRTKPQSTK